MLQEVAAELVGGATEVHCSTQHNGVRIDGMDESDDSDCKVAGGFHDDFSCHGITAFGFLGDDPGRDLFAAGTPLCERSRLACVDRSGGAIDHGRGVRIGLERAAVAERITASVFRWINQDMTAFSAATVFAFDECVADD